MLKDKHQLTFLQLVESKRITNDFLVRFAASSIVKALGTTRKSEENDMQQRCPVIIWLAFTYLQLSGKVQLSLPPYQIPFILNTYQLIQSLKISGAPRDFKSQKLKY